MYHFFYGSVETFNLTSNYLNSPYISGQFDAMVLQNPIVNVVLGNLPSIKQPTRKQTQEWNIKHNFPVEEIQYGSAVTTTAAAQKELNKFDYNPPSQNIPDTQHGIVSSSNTFVKEQEAEASLFTCINKINNQLQNVEVVLLHLLDVMILFAEYILMIK